MCCNLEKMLDLQQKVDEYERTFFDLFLILKSDHYFGMPKNSNYMASIVINKLWELKGIKHDNSETSNKTP